MRRPQAGYTLLEMLIVLLILGVIVIAVSSYQAVGYGTVTKVRRRSQAAALAASLMAQVAARHWDESATAVSGSLGPDAGETATDKTTFDDIDDFNGYTEQPPTDPANAALTGHDQYRLSVAVSFADSSLAATGTSGPRKRVTVTVELAPGGTPQKTLYETATVFSAWRVVP